MSAKTETELQGSLIGAPSAHKWISEKEAEVRQHYEECKKRLRQAEIDNLTHPPEKDGTDYQHLEKVARAHLDAAAADCESLQKRLLAYDSKIGPERRDSSEKLTREQIEGFLFLFAIHEREALRRLITIMCQELLACQKPEEVHLLLDAKFEETKVGAMDSACREGHLPGWFKSGLEEAF